MSEKPLKKIPFPENYMKMAVFCSPLRIKRFD